MLGDVWIVVDVSDLRRGVPLQTDGGVPFVEEVCGLQRKCLFCGGNGWFAEGVAGLRRECALSGRGVRLAKDVDQFRARAVIRLVRL